MLTGENIINNDNSEEQNPWQKMASELPPFEERDATEAILDGKTEYIDISKIDISTDEGKYEWLDGVLSNAIKQAQEALGEAASLDDEEQMANATYQLRYTERQQQMFNNLFDNTSDGNMLDKLRENYRKYIQFNANLSIDATDETKQTADMDYQAASDLLNIMESETVQRDPIYFGEAEIRAILSAQVDRAEKAVDDSKIKVDGYFDENGFVHNIPDGSEKRLTVASEDAEISLRETKQDAETFEMLMQDYNVSANYQVSRAIDKMDFAPIIANFIKKRTTQINQLMEASRDLAKDTPGYAENAEARKKLARERSSALRLSERYFSIPDASSDVNDGMEMEEIPAGKTLEQAEAEEAERKRKEDAEFKRRMQEYIDQRDAEKRRREQADRAAEEQEQAEAERRERIKAAQEKAHQIYQQAQEDEQEMEM